MLSALAWPSGRRRALSDQVSRTSTLGTNCHGAACADGTMGRLSTAAIGLRRRPRSSRRSIAIAVAVTVAAEEVLRLVVHQLDVAAAFELAQGILRSEEHTSELQSLR